MIQRKTFTPLPLVGSEEELADCLAHCGREGPRGGMVVWVDGQECVQIPVTQGKRALIDRVDYEDVGRFRWHAYHCTGGRTFYCRRGVHIGGDDLVLIQMHQHLMGHPAEVIDHINLNGLDNRRANLRLTDHSHNSQNGTARKGRSLKGAYRTKYGKWMSELRAHGQCWYFGTYQTELEAALAYDEGALALFGPDARLNFPDEA